MTLINHDINLDFSTSDIKRTVIKQDSNQTHGLTIKLYDNNGRIKLDSNWQYTISCRKADNTFIVNSNNISVSSNTIYVEITKQMSSCPGTEKCELLIQDGSQTLYSGTFYLYIEKNVNYGSALESTNEYDSLSDTLNQMREYEKESEKVKDHIQDISTGIDSTYNELTEAVNTTNDLIKKNKDIETNENVRKENETNRESNEQKRQEDTANAIKNANEAADNANSKANNLENKLSSHHFVLTEDKDTAGGVAGLDINSKVSNSRLYEASASTKGITQLDDSVSSNSSSKAATSKAVKAAYDKAASVNADLQTHNSSPTAHDDMRNLISGLTTRLNALADSDDTTLDQLSEIVAYIKNNKSLIDNVTTSKVNVSDIIDSLASTAVNKPLSAKQGKVIKDLMDTLTTTLENKVDKVSGKGLSTNDYTTAEKNKLAGISSSVAANVQADWNETNTSSDSYIRNKPSLDSKVNKTGDIMSGELVLKNGSMVARETGTSGVYGYVKIVQIKVLRQYIDYPIIFEIAGRGWTSSNKLYVKFESDSGSDPQLNSFLIDKIAPYKVAMVKSGASTWDIYMQKSQSYGSCIVCSMSNTCYADAVQITFPDTLVSALPSGAVEPTVITWDKAKNADTVGGMDKNQFVHKANPVFDGNLNCRGNIWFNGEDASKLMIEFLEAGDTNGHGISIGGGGMTVIGGGESAYEIVQYYTNNRTVKNGGAEKMIVGNDGIIEFLTNCQNGFSSAKHITMNTDGTITAEGLNGNATSASCVLDDGDKRKTYMKYSANCVDDFTYLAVWNPISGGVELRAFNKANLKDKLGFSTATASSNGLMSASDKQKLDGLSTSGGSRRTLVTLTTATEANKVFTLSGQDICKGLKLYFYYHSNSSQGSSTPTLVKTVILTQSALTDNAISVNGKDVTLSSNSYTNIVKGYVDTTTNFALSCKCADINNAPLFKLGNVSFSFGFGSPTTSWFSIDAVDL